MAIVTARLERSRIRILRSRPFARRYIALAPTRHPRLAAFPRKHPGSHSRLGRDWEKRGWREDQDRGRDGLAGRQLTGRRSADAQRPQMAYGQVCRHPLPSSPSPLSSRLGPRARCVSTRSSFTATPKLASASTPCANASDSHQPHCESEGIEWPTRRRLDGGHGDELRRSGRRVVDKRVRNHPSDGGTLRLLHR